MGRTLRMRPGLLKKGVILVPEFYALPIEDNSCTIINPSQHLARPAHAQYWVEGGKPASTAVQLQLGKSAVMDASTRVGHTEFYRRDTFNGRVNSCQPH